MARFITIAGPQSSGKSTVFKYLSKKYGNQNIKFVAEINPYEYKGTDHPKYLTTYGIQEILTKKTLALLRKIGDKTNFILETGPMQIIYVEKYDGIRKAETYFKKYLEISKPLNPFIIFIDTKPRISYMRRKAVYEERIQRHNLTNKKKEILKQYEEKIYELYPLWHKWLKRFPFDKKIVRNSYKTEKQYIKEVENIVKNLMSSELKKRQSVVRRRKS
jgi:thymidylate kinase